MLENAMPGEALLSNGVPADHHRLKQQQQQQAAAAQNGYPNKTLQEMAEKLEKSETGRKKLRQAISMLKEKVEANEKVLQVNEILRQECEKERLRAEAERNRAEEEKKLREQVEKEGLSAKEQLVRVLQRVDAVERNCKADHNEVERMRKEMKQAISGLGGIVKAIEAAHSSFESLEKDLLGKVSNAVGASTKCTLLAETAISDARRAQGTAAAAEKLSDSLVSRVAVLQKQGASLDQRVSLLQQEIVKRQLEPFDNEPKSNRKLASDGISLAADKPDREMVVSKNQQQACTRLTSPRTANEDCSPEGAAFTPKLIRSEVNGAKPADRDSLGTCASLCQKIRSGTKEAETIGIDSFPDGQSNRSALRVMTSSPVGGKAGLDKSVLKSSRENIVREALDAAKEKRNLQRTASSNKVILQPGKSSSCRRSTLVTLRSNGTHAAEEYPVSGDGLGGQLQLISPSGPVPALLENEKNNRVSLRRESTRGSNVEAFPERRPCIKIKLPKAPDDNGLGTKLFSGYSLLAEEEKISESPESRTKVGRNGHKRDKPPVALLTDITKLFVKEKKSREKLEQKLAALQKLLQSSEDDEFVKQGLVDATIEKSRKRKRKESATGRSNIRACGRGPEDTPVVNSNEDHSFSSHRHWVGGIGSREAVEVGASNRKSNNSATEEDPIGPFQPSANKSRHSDPRRCGEGVSDAGVECLENLKDLDGPQFPDLGPPALVPDSLAAAPNVIESCQEMAIDTEKVSGDDLSGGWDLDLEMSEDEMGEEWWTEKRILLSPSLPEVKPPSLPLEGLDSNAPLPWPAESEMNLEDISIFLDVLPSIDQEICDEERAVATCGAIAGSNSETEEPRIESVVPPLDGQRSKELQRGLAKETFSDLRICTEGTPSSDLAQCFGSGTEPSGNPGGCVEDEEKDSLIARSSFCDSMTSGLREPFCPQDVSVVAAQKSEGVDDGLTVDSELRGDDILQAAKDAVKEEKVDVAQCLAMKHVAEKFPCSVELVVGGFAQEGWVDSTWSTMRQGSLRSTTDFSHNIMEAFGRTREVLQRAWNHSNGDALGSSLAVSPKIASLFESSTLSTSDLMCIFTASLVDLHALWDNEKPSSCLGSDCKSLQLLIDIVKQVLAAEVLRNSLSPDQAFVLFAVQLQKFLIQGTIQPVRQRISEETLDEGCAMEQSFHFATPSSKLMRLKALISGGKLLAVLCKTNGKLDFLRNSVYLVLRFCDMDNECLLAIISSLACVVCESVFSVDKDDVVGQAVQVVISELIHDAEMERPAESSTKREEVQCENKIQQGSLKVAESADCTLLLQNLRVLRAVIGEEQALSFEGFVPKLVELFHGVITASPGSHLMGNRHLFQRSLRTTTCGKIIPNSPIDAEDLVSSEQSVKTSQSTDVTSADFDVLALQSGKKDDDVSSVEDYFWRDITLKWSIQPVRQANCDARLIEEWEQKFYDITSALELVASHLGWEWTYNDFIVEHLWKLVSPGAPPMTVACVAHLFGLLGRLGREVDSTELPGVDELRKSLLAVLSLDQMSPTLVGDPMHSFSFRAQVAAAQALLVLSNSNRKDEVIPRTDPKRVFSKSSELHAKSVKSLWNWVQAFKPEIQEILPSSVRYPLLSIDKNNFVPIF